MPTKSPSNQEQVWLGREDSNEFSIFPRNPTNGLLVPQDSSKYRILSRIQVYWKTSVELVETFRWLPETQGRPRTIRPTVGHYLLALAG
jgi:hypothetical protein